jgi:uncharacterized protein DUF1552
MVAVMFLTRKHLSRRTLLKGAGFSLALPLLDAMIPAATALAQTAAARKLRAGFFYLPHGAIMDNTPFGATLDRWTPNGTGASFQLNVITKSLEPYKKYVTSLGNIKNDTWAGTQHTLNPATWLSGMRPDDRPVTPHMCATLDQVIAGQIRQDTPLPSLQVSSDSTGQQANNGLPYLTLSFSDATTPQRMEYNPREVFLKLFGPPDRAQAKKETASLLDLINEQTRALQGDLGPTDRAVLDNYLDSVRDVERDLPANRDLNGVTLPTIPKGPADSFDKQVDLMFDLIALAYRTDMTRVVTFMMAAERTNQTYDHIGVPDSFHPLSHHANDPARIEKLARIQTWHTERFARFLGMLAAVPDGEGTLLDNSMFLYGSNMSNSNQHTSHPLPTLLVGGGGGKLSGGRHLSLPQPTPISNLHLTLLNKAGMERTVFGDSTGTITL